MAADMLNLETLPRGRRLRVRRTVLGLSQTALARMLGLPAERVSEAECESRYRSPEKIEELQSQIDAALTKLERRHCVASEQSEGERVTG
jgi:transcriptional regulator with XRE-family HTH domain